MYSFLWFYRETRRKSPILGVPSKRHTRLAAGKPSCNTWWRIGPPLFFGLIPPVLFIVLFRDHSSSHTSWRRIPEEDGQNTCPGVIFHFPGFGFRRVQIREANQRVPWHRGGLLAVERKVPKNQSQFSGQTDPLRQTLRSILPGCSAKLVGSWGVHPAIRELYLKWRSPLTNLANRTSKQVTVLYILVLA